MGIKDTILSAPDARYDTVDVPEWNTKIRIKAFSAGERDQLEMQILKARMERTSVQNLRAKIAALIIVDDDGNRVFGDGDVPELAKKSAKALDRIFDAHVKLNALSEDEAKDYEKNS